MTKLFSFNELENKDADISKSELLSKQFTEIHQQKIGAVKNLAGRFPSKEEAFFLWTVNQFNAFSFIPYMINQVNRIDELIISTYSINIKIIDSLAAFVRNGNISNLFILISDSANFRIPKVVDHLKATENAYPQINIRFAWNHSKITLMKTANDFYCIEGSGNFSENSRHEQYIFLNSQEIYEFRKKWIINEIHGRTV